MKDVDTSGEMQYVSEYFRQMFGNQIQFVSFNKERLKCFNITYPEYVQVTIKSGNFSAFRKCFKELEKNDQIDTEKTYHKLGRLNGNRFRIYNISKEKNDYRNRKKNNYKFDITIKRTVDDLETAFFKHEYKNTRAEIEIDLLKSIFENFFINIQYRCPEMDKNTHCKVYNIIKSIANNHYLTTVEDRMNEFLDSLKTLGVTMEVIAAKYSDFLSYFYSLNINENISFLGSFYIATDKKDSERAAFLDIDIVEFYDAYKKSVVFDDFLTFSWGLSSGETLLLNNFSKLFSVLKNVNGRMAFPNEMLDNYISQTSQLKTACAS